VGDLPGRVLFGEHQLLLVEILGDDLLTER
jgi:hypothetical protein